jgi:uncharacterized repeat protein (TIGR01451 family)
VSAVAGSSTISLTGGTVAGASNCSFFVNVKGTTAGVKNNVTGTIFSTEGGTGGTASANVTVVEPPTLTKSFDKATVPVNGTATLTFTITNPNAGVALSAMSFSDTFPSGLVVATPNGQATTCVGATITAVAASGSVTVSGLSLAASASCTISVDVKGTVAGVKNNTSSAITSTEGGNGAVAKATLTVLAPPSLAKAFSALKVAQAGLTTLTFTVSNTNASDALTGIAFTDPLPAGLVVAVAPVATTTCGGSVTAVAGSSSVSFSGGTVGAGTSCTVSVKLKANTEGVKNNVTGAVSSTNGGTGNTATASITVIPRVKGDVDRNGTSDLFWRNHTTGANTIWYMNGTAFNASGAIGPLPSPNLAYRIVGTDDFNGDGIVDILWRNTTTGQNAIWVMNDVGWGYTIVDLPGLDPSFHLSGTGDFNGDGYVDIMIRRPSTGQNALWLMNGTAFSAIVDLPALQGTAWELEGAADFNADGKMDIVLRNYSSGSNVVWLMNGTTYAGISNLPGLTTAYKLAAVADMNGDKKPDLVWRNQTSGANAIWLMNGPNFASIVDLPVRAAPEELEGPR